MAKKKNYKYLLDLYSRVDSFLSKSDYNLEELPEVVVSFCVVVEKILKIKLHRKHPILVFDCSRIKTDDALVMAALKKENDMETAKIGSIAHRYSLVFKEDFSEDQMQALLSIYDIRNHLVHGHKSDEFLFNDQENIVKKIGIIWPCVTKQILKLFGKNIVKISDPKNKYTKEELVNVLREEVIKKIDSKEFNTNNNLSLNVGLLNYVPFSGLMSNTCPRCGGFGFVTGNFEESPFAVSSSSFLVSRPYASVNRSNLYRCRNCNLELTEKEYEIAQDLMKRDSVSSGQ